MRNRNYLRGLPGSIASTASLGMDTGDTGFCSCNTHRQGSHAGYLPNVVVETHDQRRVLFYDDLLLGKLVLANCMSVRESAGSPSLPRLAVVQELLDTRLGRDIFIYSITVDPQLDTPHALRQLAKFLRAREGWLFLTGDPAELRVLRERLFGHSGDHGRETDMIRYGNETAGLWGGIMATARPESIVERLSWIDTRGAGFRTLRRGGPPPLPAGN